MRGKHTGYTSMAGRAIAGIVRWIQGYFRLFGFSAFGWQSLQVPHLHPDQCVLLDPGIVDKLQAPWPTFTNIEYAMLNPLNSIGSSTTYLIRTEPGQRDRLMLEVEELLANSNSSRIIRNLRSLGAGAIQKGRQNSTDHRNPVCLTP